VTLRSQYVDFENGVLEISIAKYGELPILPIDRNGKRLFDE